MPPVRQLGAPTVHVDRRIGEDVDEDDEWDDASEWDALPEWGPGPDDTHGSDNAAAVGDAPTPGERLLYALGQLFLLWHRGELSVEPRDFDVEDLARIIGVARDIEFSSDARFGRCFHFPSEVLLVDGAQRFPWSLLSLDSWASLMDAADRS